MPDKSLARQVFPPGLVGDLMYKASQMMPMNAFAQRMLPQQQPIQQQQPIAAPQQGAQMQPQPGMMPQQGIMQQQQPGGVHPGLLQQPMQPQPVAMQPNQNIFASRMARY